MTGACRGWWSRKPRRGILWALVALWRLCVQWGHWVCRCVCFPGRANRKLEWRDAQGRLHRDYDLPAVVWPGHYCEWWVHGERRRVRPEDPHVLFDVGERQWLDARGYFHRDDDLPAIEWPGQFCAWFVHGKLHRQRSEDPHIVYDDGEQQWRDEDENLHRDHGLPAVVGPGTLLEWYHHGERVAPPPWIPAIVWQPYSSVVASSGDVCPICLESSPRQWASVCGAGHWVCLPCFPLFRDAVGSGTLRPVCPCCIRPLGHVVTVYGARGSKKRPVPSPFTRTLRVVNAPPSLPALRDAATGGAPCVVL